MRVRISGVPFVRGDPDAGQVEARGGVESIVHIQHVDGDPQLVQPTGGGADEVGVAARMQEQEPRPYESRAGARELVEALEHRDRVASARRQERVRVVRAADGARTAGRTARRRARIDDRDPRVADGKLIGRRQTVDPGTDHRDIEVRHRAVV